MRRILIFFVILLSLSACQVEVPGDSNADSSAQKGISQVSADIGKTLTVLKSEHPTASVFDCPDGYPDAAAVCFSEPEAQFAYVFMGAQSGDYHSVMKTCADELKCCGILSTVGVLFSDVPDTIAFTDSFALLGVSEYFFEEEEISTQGWLTFVYDNKTVWINTNKRDDGGGWVYTGNLEIMSNAPVIITDEEILAENLIILEQNISI